jgi:SAM-dependent methyltransferase
VTEPDHLSTTREAYDAVATEYAEHFGNALETRPLDRALLAAFAELARDIGLVADVGCGPGYRTAHLHELGVPAFGVDLSPEMVALAREANPELRFDEGSMTALDLPDGGLGGVLAWYSVIHTPPDQVPLVLEEFHRILAPGGHLLLAFQTGETFQTDETRAFDHRVAIAYQWPIERMAGLLRDAGFDPFARMRREAAEDERFPEGCLPARKPADS